MGNFRHLARRFQKLPALCSSIAFRMLASCSATVFTPPSITSNLLKTPAAAVSVILEAKSVPNYTIT
jgi:hypothetical protein